MKEFPSAIDAEEAVVGAVLLKGNDIFTKCDSWIRDSEAFIMIEQNQYGKLVVKCIEMVKQ